MTGDPTDDDVLAEAVDWRLRIDAAPDNAELNAALEAWLSAGEAHRRAYRDVERLAHIAEALPADYADLEEALLDSRERTAPTVARRSFRLGRAGLAAVALIACLAFVYLPTLQLWLASDYRTATAELGRRTLDDGSIVSLGAESAIAVNYSAARREVLLLAGRAFFEVVPAVDRPFVVVAGGATVTVTGTAFGVRATAGTLSVAVEAGTVEVRLDHGHRLAATLMRGERIEIDRRSGQVARSAIVPADVAAWREHRLVVDQATLADVVDELGRHYGGVVVLRDRALGARRVSGVFDLRQPIEALQAAVRTHDGSLTRITRYVVVISGP